MYGCLINNTYQKYENIIKELYDDRMSYDIDKLICDIDNAYKLGRLNSMQYDYLMACIYDYGLY